MSEQPNNSTTTGERNRSTKHKSHPKQRRNAPPVEPEVVQQPTEPTSKNKFQKKKTGLAASLGTPIPRGNPDAFKPIALTTTGSKERNDPLLLDAVLVDGIRGAVLCARDRKFSLDYSQYIQIIRASYHVMTRLDRGLLKFMSFSVYQYYCIILLWKRLRFVLTEKGEGVNEYETLKRRLPPMSIPDEIGYYLDGIGNISDYNARNYMLQIQCALRISQVSGISGTFGRIDSVTHIAYETLPSPFVAVYRILQDVARTSGARRAHPIYLSADWDLPVELKPEGQFIPNRNLLGWDKSSVLTSEQMAMCNEAGLNVDFVEDVPQYETSGVSNFDGIPIIYPMLLQTSELLSGSKSPYNNHAESTSYKGSLAQVGYTKRADIITGISGYALPPLSEREGTAIFYGQVSIHMCSAASLFRYRLKRVMHGAHDSLCYTGIRGGAPPGWDANADEVYLGCPEWNQEEFRTTMVSGIGTCDRYSERIRKISPHEQ